MSPPISTYKRHQVKTTCHHIFVNQKNGQNSIYIVSQQPYIIDNSIIQNEPITDAVWLLSGFETFSTNFMTLKTNTHIVLI